MVVWLDDERRDVAIRADLTEAQRASVLARWAYAVVAPSPDGATFFARCPLDRRAADAARELHAHFGRLTAEGGVPRAEVERRFAAYGREAA